MATSLPRVRQSFSNLHEVLDLPDLIAVQRESFEWFLEQGVAEVLADISPIEDFTGSSSSSCPTTSSTRRSTPKTSAASAT